MASLRATLEFAGKEYDVLHSEYECSRTTDAKGKPSSNIQGGRVSVVIESTDEMCIRDRCRLRRRWPSGNTNKTKALFRSPI